MSGVPADLGGPEGGGSVMLLFAVRYDVARKRGQRESDHLGLVL